MLRGIDLDVDDARGRRADRRERLGQVDAAAHDQPARDRSTTARSSSTARTSATRASTPTPCAPASASSSSTTTCSRTSRVLDNVTLAAAHRASDAAEPTPSDAASRCSTRVGLADKARGVPRPALRRPAAARRRSCARSPPTPSCCCSTRSRARSTPSSSARCSTSCASSPTSGTTIVMATHEMAFARDVADRVVFLDAGRHRSRTGTARRGLRRAARGPHPRVPDPLHRLTRPRFAPSLRSSLNDRGRRPRGSRYFRGDPQSSGRNLSV